MLRKAKLSISIFGVLAILAATTLIKSPPAQAFGGGTGSPSNPYQISTCQDLQDVANHPVSSYILINDVDCSATNAWNSGAGFNPIDYFSGTLDGQNHTVNDIYINQQNNNGYDVGLFSDIGYASIKNLTLDGIHIEGGSGYNAALTGYGYDSQITNVQIINGDMISPEGSSVGLIAGNISSTIISASSATGTILKQGTATIGGLVGASYQNTIINSYADVAITIDAATGGNIGGLVGQSSNDIIAKSYSAGSITAQTTNSTHIGGLAGYADGSIHDNFITTSLQAAECGSNNCGGITYSGSGQFTNNYFDETTVSYPGCGFSACTAVNSDGLSPNYFKNNTTNAPLDTWDFSTVWQTTSGLPVLRSNAPLEATNPAPTNVAVETLDSTSVRVTWDAAASGYVTGYNITSFGHDNPNVLSNGPQGNDDAGNTSTYDITGLLPTTQFSVVVRAKYAYGAPVPSQPVEAVTTQAGFHPVNTCTQLQDITNNTVDNYQLTKDIDCSDTVNWNDGRGFLPIGTVLNDQNEMQGGSYFTGIFYGNNHVISGLYQNWPSYGLFGVVLGTVQDVTLANPILYIDGSATNNGDSGDSVAGTIAGTLYAGNLTNVHVTNGQIAANNALIVGGLVGMHYMSGAITHSSFQGSIIGSHQVAGGLVGVVSPYGNGGYGTIAISDSYANSDIQLTTTPDNSDFIGGGGLVGYADYREGDNGPNDIVYINRSYAIGSMDYSGATISQFLGGLIGGGYQIDIANSFSSMVLNGYADGDTIETLKGSILSVSTLFGNNPTITTNGVYAAGSDPCSADGTASCTTVGDPSYFYNNQTNPPLDQWDFASIWQTTSTYPKFLTSAGPSPIIPNTTDLTGLGPLGPIRLPSLFSKTTDAPATAIAATTTGGTLRIANRGTAETPSSNPIAQVAAAIKEFVKSLPPGVVIAFPYALFGLLGIGILALLIELGFELRRTHLLEALLHKQQLLAEERDAFWHLAANYLRAPVTLIVGGAEALRESHQTDGTTAIATLASSLQTKVGEIMKKIEGSTSLQAIKGTHVHPVTNIARKAIFIVPLTVVAILVVFGNYAATSYRNLSPGFVGYAAQIIIFMVVTIALYWAVRLLTQGKNKRKATQELLDVQATELANARHELIEDTAKNLNPDLTRLEGMLKGLPAPMATTAVGALATLHEGSDRLRGIVTSFALLIKVQEGTGQVVATPGATDLSGILNNVRSKLTPEITKKGVRISAPAVPLAVAAESDMAKQVIESILANAVDYSPAGGTVKVEARQLQDQIQLRISDQGKGIDKKQLDHLFQPFVRTDGTSAMDMSHGGFGINLYLDKLIMEQMGGSISAASTPGKGTAITMSWPSA